MTPPPPPASERSATQRRSVQTAATPDAFTGQLSPPGYVLDVRPGRALPAREPGEAATISGTLPCVLLLSRSCDADLDVVSELLGRVGVPTARLNADELATVDLLIDPARGAVRIDGRWLAPTVIWNRHFSAHAIEGSGSPARDMFRRDSWQAVAGQLSALSPAAIGARRPGLFEQLLLARRHRIAIPRTVVTTDPARARDLLGGARLIVKAVHHHFVEAAPGLLSGVFPVVVEPPDPSGVPPPGPPVVVQEYIEHEAELRVYYVHGQVHGFEISKGPASDLWLAADRVGVRPAQLPAAVVSATRLLAAGLTLRYGAFDFLLQAGTPVFLEVNPDGDWRWAEVKARTAPVTQAVARMLCELHRKFRPAGAEPGSPGRDRLDLISFLSASPSPRFT